MLIITGPVENLEQVNGHLDPGQAKSITSEGSQDSPEFVFFEWLDVCVFAGARTLRDHVQYEGGQFVNHDRADGQRPH